MSLKFGNRVTEKDIRHWLDDHEFNGDSAQITELELHAVKRPGWVQLFRFRLTANRKMETAETDFTANARFKGAGVVLDDERIRDPRLKTQVWIFESDQQQAEKLQELSSDMLTCRTGQNGNVLGMVGLFILLFLIALVSMSFFNFLT